MRNSVTLYTDYTDLCLPGPAVEETVEFYKVIVLRVRTGADVNRFGAYPKVIAVEAERA